jgi:hypothetical protein
VGEGEHEKVQDGRTGCGTPLCTDGDFKNNQGYTCADLRKFADGGQVDWTDPRGNSAGKQCCQFCTATTTTTTTTAATAAAAAAADAAAGGTENCADVSPPQNWRNPTCTAQLAAGKCPTRVAKCASGKNCFCQKTCGVCLSAAAKHEVLAGFGRIAVSEIEVPNMLVNMVWSG